ncbi:pre-mRNA splicing factor, putative [Talaromyces stipitatus ATCC 10500]|uniref:Pre-mRNA splicing factor, putative n=1 Tax=Talaromyces stipitatus (strain ATCC 10500 / CBS 375.48 / QM 6759 / NRRL 1006) TaxID=441959 RepID=B8MHS1_TALSN|nr:pre-mRNA splicing factor, putative [Talaromyces stipitatus ATCC 10500]EED16401.1 pre-mRNA splicing factor, putative [Talaromyces stipitatus ATCC 10500]
MPGCNVTTKKTSKTSSYFVRSRGKKSTSGNGDLLQTWGQVKKRKPRNDEVKKLKSTICTLDEESLGAGSSTCQGVVFGSETCEDLTAQTELHDGAIKMDSMDHGDTTVDAHVLTEQVILRPTINTAAVDGRGDILHNSNGDITNGALTQISQVSQPEEHQEENRQQKRAKSQRKQPPKLSPYFPRPLPLIETSCLPFPSVSAPTFGLIQEQLALSPFRLLIATIFLNRTRGPVAIPVLFKLFDFYPTIEDMAAANHEDIVHIIRGLGFQNQRATKFIALARKWLDSPPERGKRYRKLNYPCKKAGTDIAADEVVPDEDDGERSDRRVAWEIAHLPGIGAYAIDSWRIFCRDRLRYGSESPSASYEPEWKRVFPQDKELRAYVSWKWLSEGWVWNCENGSRTKADSELMKRAERGGVAFEGGDGHLVVLNIRPSSGGSVEERDGCPVLEERSWFVTNYLLI